MNANYGLMPELGTRARGKQKKMDLAARALAAIDGFVAAAAFAGPKPGAAPVLQEAP